jgi:hypothetical protein
VNVTRALTLRAPLTLTALALLGCSLGTDPSDDLVSLRMVNALTEGPQVVFVIDGEPVTNRVNCGEASGYQTARAKGVLEVRHAISNTTLLTQTLNLAATGVYTMLLSRPASELELTIYPDTGRRPSPGTAKLRVIHAASSAAPIDLYLTEPGSGGQVPWLRPFDYQSATPHREGPPGTYTISAYLAGTDHISGMDSLELAAGRAKTVVILDGDNIYIAFLELSDFL